MSDSTIAASEIQAIAQKLPDAPQSKQIQLLQQLAEGGEAGIQTMIDFLQARENQPATMAMGKAYQLLVKQDHPQAQNFVQNILPQGVVTLPSDREIDYQPLQEQLTREDFLKADRETAQRLCELGGEMALKRKWLYFTEAARLPVTDLRTINTLWQVYSEGKFGYSVQRELWLSAGKDWEKFWQKIDWKNGNKWTRYPNEFTWDLSAPKGHLPLSNQLRGVRVLKEILTHPAWQQDQ